MYITVVPKLSRDKKIPILVSDFFLREINYFFSKTYFPSEKNSTPED
jgi:hypothetical protein